MDFTSKEQIETVLKIFSKLSFNEGEQQIFIDNLRNKGLELHKHVYDIYNSYVEEKITYDELSHFIRYDKSIRRVLYKYLATFEEQLRAELINNFDYSNKPNSINDTIDPNQLIKKKNKMDLSNLYWFSFTKNFTFGNLIDCIEHKMDEINISITKDDLLKIRVLRNKVMHHSLILVADKINYIDAEAEIELMEKTLIILYKELHNEAKEHFMKEINTCNFKSGDTSNPPNFTRLRLGVFMNGVFDKSRYEKE